MNGTGAREPFRMPPAPIGDPDVIRAMEEALAMAKAGKLTTLGIAGIAGGAFHIAITGPQIPLLSTAAAQLHRMTLELMFPTQQPRPQSGLLIPGR